MAGALRERLEALRGELLEEEALSEARHALRRLSLDALIDILGTYERRALGELFGLLGGGEAPAAGGETVDLSREDPELTVVCFDCPDAMEPEMEWVSRDPDLNVHRFECPECGRVDLVWKRDRGRGGRDGKRK